MNQNPQNLTYHFNELKRRLIYVLSYFIIFCGLSYYFAADLYEVLLTPLVASMPLDSRIIYTNLTEMFLSYLRLAVSSGFILTLPIIAFNIYRFIEPGLYKYEKSILRLIMLMLPIMYYIGICFNYFIIIPTAWKFLLGFGISGALPFTIHLEAKVSEYFKLIMDMNFAFGMAFELPAALMLLTNLGITNASGLKKFRRFAIVFAFLFGGILTPPDVFSQFALAIPLIILYEISIKICKTIENLKVKNARYKMD